MSMPRSLSNNAACLFPALQYDGKGAVSERAALKGPMPGGGKP